MIKKIVTLFLLTGFSLNFNGVLAQESINVADTLKGWEYSWIASLNGSQAAYSNWAQGGVNTISGTGSSVFGGKFRKDRYAYGFVVNFKYGKSRIEDEGVRKTDDRIAIKNRWAYNLSKENNFFNVFATAGLQTQFDKGFEYDAGPNGEDILISKFFAPGYFTETAGLAYQPNNFLSFEAGVGLKQTIVTEDSLATLYGVDEGENFRSEGGLTLGINFEKEIAQNILLASTAGTFTNFRTSISSTDFSWANQLTGKINDFVNASLQFELVFDDDFSDEVQTKQVLSLGLSFNVF